MRRCVKLTALLVLTAACGPLTPEAQVQAYVNGELDAFLRATQRLYAAAPRIWPDGWQMPRDRQAVEASKMAWKDARVAYEHIESAIATLFPDQDHAVDGRYDEFPAQRGTEPGPVPNAFDGEAMTGMHAIERILWSDSIPAAVRTFERQLNRYQEPAFPATAAQAQAYRDVLIAQLARDIQSMQAEARANRLDLAAAFGGVIDSLKEQREKVNLADHGSDESRYAQHTLADMRANLEGGRAMYEIYRPKLQAQINGKAVDAAILERFEYLGTTYDAYPGDSLPAPPAGWSAQNVRKEHLETPYGTLWARVRQESDPLKPESLVALMQQAEDLLRLDAP